MARILLWGIVVMVGLGVLLEAVDVHGARDERAAIRHAIKSSFADLKRRDAHALCGDFTPSAAAFLSPAPGRRCEVRVHGAFATDEAGHGGAIPYGTPSSAHLRVLDIHWHGDSATADALDPSAPGERQTLRLSLLGRRWRLATPARLEMQARCQGPPVGARTCIRAMSMRFATDQPRSTAAGPLGPSPHEGDSSSATS
jgi:hypothetical protein